MIVRKRRRRPHTNTFALYQGVSINERRILPPDVPERARRGRGLNGEVLVQRRVCGLDGAGARVDGVDRERARDGSRGENRRAGDRSGRDE